MDYILGIHWLNNQLKIACLKKEGKGFRLIKLESLDSASFKDWLASNFPPEAHLTTVLAIPESAIFLKELDLPLLKDKELKEAIYWEAANIFPFSVSEAVIGWQRISQKDKTQKVALVAVKDSTAEVFSSFFDKAEISLSAIEPVSLSTARAIKAGEKPILLVFAENKETNLVILKNGFPIFSTSVAVSLKGSRGHLRKINNQVKSTIVSNAKKIISFWEDKEKEKISQVLITGSGVKYSGLASAINHYTHTPVLIAKSKFKLPIISTLNQPKATLNRFLIPLGAALRPLIVNKQEELNLLPQKDNQILVSQRKQNEKKEKISLFSRVTFILLLASLLTWGVFKYWSLRTEKQLRDARALITTHPAQKFISEISTANKLITEISLLIQQQKDTGQRLAQIAQFTPTRIQLTALQFNQLTQEQWEIKGVGNREDILAFYYQLKTVPGLSGVSMPYSNLQKNEENNFKIVILW